MYTNSKRVLICYPPTRQYIYTKVYGVITHKTVILLHSALRTSNLTNICYLSNRTKISCFYFILERLRLRISAQGPTDIAVVSSIPCRNRHCCLRNDREERISLGQTCPACVLTLQYTVTYHSAFLRFHCHRTVKHCVNMTLECK